MPSGLSPEQRRIVDCAWFALGLEPLGADDPVDWGGLLALAGEQGLVPLVHAALNGPCADAPAGAREFLTLGNRRAQRRLADEVEPTLRRVLTLLHDAQLRPVVLKGAALAYTAYPASLLRTFTDLDLLLPRGQLARAQQVLLAAGFQTTDDEQDLAHGHHHLPALRERPGSIELELHHHLVDARGPYAIDLGGMLARSRSALVAGVETRILAPTDTLFHVALHLAYGHAYRWYVLRGLCDLLALTHAPSGIDWELMTRLATDSGAGGALYWPLWLARRWLGAPIPSAILERIAPPRAVRQLTERAFASAFVLDGGEPTGGGTAVLHELLVRMSLYSGCSAAAQVTALANQLFPAAGAVTHLPAEVTQSRRRYLGTLLRPRRFVHGAGALARLVFGPEQVGRPSVGVGDRLAEAARRAG